MDNTTKHICGVCNDEWLTEAEYLNHTCSTGFTPAQPEHLINSTTPDFAEISQAAVARGAESVDVPASEPESNPVPDEPEVAPAPAMPTPEVAPESPMPSISLN